MTTESLIREGEQSLGRGGLDSAERAFRSALESTRDQSLQAQALSGLATVYREQKQYDQMVRCALEALLRNEKFWGPQSLQAADSTVLAAEGFVRSNQPLRAQPLFLHALEVRLMHYEPRHEQIITLQAALLLISLEQGRIEKVIELHQILLPLYRRVEAGGSWVHFLKFDQLVERHCDRDLRKDAELLMKSELSILHEHFFPNRDEFNAVLKLYKTFVSKYGRLLAEWQLGVMQHDERKHERQPVIPQETNQGILDNFKSRMDGMNTGNQMRQEFPNFLDSVASLVECGVSVNAAIVQSAQSLTTRTVLGRELDKAVQDWTTTNKPLSQSFVEIGQRVEVPEITQFGSMLAVIHKTGGNYAPILREQSFAIKYHFEAKRIELESLTTTTRANTWPLKKMQADEDRRKRRAKGGY